MEKKQNNKILKPELLAPAGNLDCALAAFQSGADAVYAGLGRFNAREMGENFSWDDMSRLSAYAKNNNKKFYLTFNTLIKENEIIDFGHSVEQIEKLAPDAVIVQDLGVLRFLREYFPSITIHASTQMGIHNSAGVKLASKMGAERVILERQIKLEELKEICKQPVEIEVFIHGALCCSISGHCLFSSWLGGWSGNRGRCKQPCRRRFHSEINGQKKSGFFFSTQDFYSLDMLDELKEAGVCSLKIEGRLKKPDYVKSVVSAYRMMLDTSPSEKPAALKEARQMLSSSNGRKWSHGFSSSEDMQSLIQFSSAGVSGRLAGSIDKTAKNGFQVEVIQRLHVGDRIRIQPKSGDEGPSITITKMSINRKSVMNATKGAKVFIHCDKNVHPQSLVYKIGESRSESVKRPANLPLYNPPIKVNLSVKVTEDGIEAIAKLPESSSEVFEWKHTEKIDLAQKRPLEEQTVAEAFSTTRNEALKVSAIQTEIIQPENSQGFFIPAGNLKKIRRSFWEWLETKETVAEAIANRANAVNFTETAEEDADWLKKFNKDLQTYKETASTLKKKEALKDAEFGKNNSANSIIVKDISSFLNEDLKADELLLPFFCPENNLDSLKTQIKKSFERGIRRYRISSIYQIQLLNEAVGDNLDEVFLSSTFPLPAANSLAAKELHSLGVKRCQIWLELDKEAIELAAQNWPVTAEMYRYGRPFLLASRAQLSVEGLITDSRGKTFEVKKAPLHELDFSENDGLSFIFPTENIALPEIKDCANYYETFNEKNGGEETSFNYDFTLV
ncbi:MAG: DUF3656 domain-containing protein [Spirochaetales bacterium]|nr:DUF3656 domain-containing protein [Spirochaetales bacterium]